MGVSEAGLCEQVVTAVFGVGRPHSCSSAFRALLLSPSGGGAGWDFQFCGFQAGIGPCALGAWSEMGHPAPHGPGTAWPAFPPPPKFLSLRSLDTRPRDKKAGHGKRCWKNHARRHPARQSCTLWGHGLRSPPPAPPLCPCDQLDVAQSSPAWVDFLRAFLMSSSVLLLSLISSCWVFISRSLCRSVRAFRACGPMAG